MLIFLKLGGSLITDKSQIETPRPDVIARLAGEIAQALQARPDLSLLIGHGSGSFGHVAAQRYGTRHGVTGDDAWYGFARVAAIAAKLNRVVYDALLEVEVPVFRVQPSASAICRNGRLVELAVKPILRALEARLVPLVYGDVALDEIQGGTIISTEDIFVYLARSLSPDRILLAGEFDGVADQKGAVVPHITPTTLNTLRSALGDSTHADVTGGMATKVDSMLALCASMPGLTVHIFSGQTPGSVFKALTQEQRGFGTWLTA